MDIANLLFLLADLAVFGLNLKLYTELMKDRNMNARAQQKQTNEKPQ